MHPAVRRLLKRVSRSLYLSLRVLPEPVREAMGLGYLFCRAADTIADTRLVPVAERLRTLEAYRGAFEGGPAPAAPPPGGEATDAERELLARLPETIELWRRQPEGERELLRQVVAGVTDGMRLDLASFPAEEGAPPRALPDAAALERYCGLIGGAPGRFWTDLCLLRLPALWEADAGALRQWGFRLGQGLQITNILRDLPKDLRLGRCYLPEPELREAGLEPSDLLDPAAIERLRPVLRRWFGWALQRLEAGASYVEAMPAWRLRAAVAWPLLLAFQTLLKVSRSEELLDPGRPVKVSRRHVYRMLAGSPWTLSTTARFRRRFETLRGRLAGEPAAAPRP
jgi:farnesyl-diphosphate farnesyltransferase